MLWFSLTEFDLSSHFHNFLFLYPAILMLLRDQISKHAHRRRQLFSLHIQCVQQLRKRFRTLVNVPALFNEVSITKRRFSHDLR